MLFSQPNMLPTIITDPPAWVPACSELFILWLANKYSICPSSREMGELKSPNFAVNVIVATLSLGCFFVAPAPAPCSSENTTTARKLPSSQMFWNEGKLHNQQSIIWICKETRGTIWNEYMLLHHVLLGFRSRLRASVDLRIGCNNPYCLIFFGACIFCRRFGYANLSQSHLRAGCCSSCAATSVDYQNRPATLSLAGRHY